MPDATGARDPIVLEGQQCVGGRILTLREPFAPGLWAEAGAMRIPRSHARTRCTKRQQLALSGSRARRSRLGGRRGSGVLPCPWVGSRSPSTG
ncbi:MAG: FAD-dependent oxidoreductase [Acidimicrobiia bacterium]